MDVEARYEFLEKIGAGTFATVYRARDNELGREVAVKTIHAEYLADFSKLEKYWHEAQLLASLHHPNVVTIFDLHRDKGWLIQELMQASLADRMGGRQMDVRSLKTTVAHVLRALKFIHSRGIVHGDIKPGNLMIDARRRVKIGDFGLSRRVSDADGSLLKGTTKYMAPEVVSEEFGDVGPASDLYSLGFTAYELLCGSNFEDLFPGLSAFGRNKQVAWMMWHAAADRRLPEISRVLEGVPEDLAKVVQKLCEKDQSKRYRTADEALADLAVDQKVVKEGEGGADVSGDGDAADPGRRRRLVLLGGALGLSAVLSVALLFSGGGKEPDKPTGPDVWIVSEVFPDQGRLKVEDVERTRAEERDLGRNPSIYLESDGVSPGSGKNILLRELLPGDRIVVSREDDGKGGAIVRVKASRPVTTHGRIEQIDLAASRLVLREETGKLGGELPVRIPERAAIQVNGGAARMQDVLVGDKATVVHLGEADKRGGRFAVSLDVRRLVEATGFVTGVDTVQRKVGVRLGAPGSGDRLELPVSNECRIVATDVRTRETKPLRLEEIRAEDRVKVQHHVEFQSIEVTRDRRRVAAGIEEIRLAQRQLVVTTADGRKLVLDVPATADVTLGADQAKFELLRRFDRVEVGYDEPAPGTFSVSSLDARRPVDADRHAVVLGFGGYEDPSLTKLPFTVEDARLIHDVLLRRGGVAPEKALFLLDEPKAVVEQKMNEFLATLLPQSEVVVYVAGHAYQGDDGRVRLAPRDFRLDRLDRTGIPFDDFLMRLDKSPARAKLLLLDVCHAGSGTDLNREPATAVMVRKLPALPEKTVIVASCDDGQRGQNLLADRHGAFAHFLALGLGGEADVDLDAEVSPKELFDFLRAGMAEKRFDGLPQTPVLFVPPQ